MPMMKCGHAANALMGDTKRPCCVICHGNPLSKQIADKPDLAGRLAKCGCGNTRESSTSLAFFEYLGPNSYYALNMCKRCNYYRNTHQPKWKAEVECKRRWFKIPECIDIVTHEFFAPHYLTMLIAEKFYQSKIEDINRDYSNCCEYTQKFHEDTKVKSVKLIGVKQISGYPKCLHFEPAGAQKYDRFYCGCRGWD